MGNITIENFQDYLSLIQKINEKLQNEKKDYKNQIFYRGQSSINYDLEPSIFRKGAKKIEQDIYLKILSECSNDFNKEMTHIDRLSKMQHYGVPTRLLDVTTNPLVALYFACESEKNKSEDGRIYVFNTKKKKIKSFDSDTVSILSSLPRFNEKDKENLKKLSEEYKEKIKKLEKENPNLKKLLNEDIIELSKEDSDLKNSLEKYKNILNKFNQERIVKRLLHEIKTEKPAFEDIIEPKHLLKSYFVLPKKDNPRIIRQSGAFIIYGLNDKDLEIYKKITIPSLSKKDILNQLKYCGISKPTLHPELYKMSEYIKDCLDNNRPI